MKQLFSRTTTLLRTVLLFGVLSFVNIQQTQAQPVSLTADMPDAFETKAPVIGDGEYYFIQFYYELNNSPYLYQSFMGELGEGGQIQAMDYLPFAANRQWTLVKIDDSEENKYKFKLKSKRGYYAYRDINRFFTTATEANATVFTYKTRGSYRPGFIELLTSDGVEMGRWSGSEWGGLINVNNGNSNTTNSVGYVRLAKLKAGAAHIIYYREGGADNSDPQASTIRHYLTYSGADYGLTSLINNGSFEGTDVSSFFSPNSGTSSTITDGAGQGGSRGISIRSNGEEQFDWNTQFIIKSNNVIPIGTKVRVEFDYRADTDVNGVPTQAQALQGQYNHYDAIGSIDFRPYWQRFSKEITVTEDMGNNPDEGRYDTFQCIAINLGTKANTTFYFDNIIFTIPDNTEVSSRQSIIPSDKSLWTLPTIAAYHQDGLWTLEETDDDGEFYIKKYGEEQYLTVEQVNTWDYRTVLGSKDYVHGKFNLEYSDAIRYTRIHNNTATNVWGYPRYLTHSNGDGWPVVQTTGEHSDYWYAGFLPVEVPEPNKDEFFQVRLVLNPPNGTEESRQPIPLTGGDITPSGTKYTPTGDLQRCFRHQNLQVPSGYDKIVVRFAEPVVGSGWNINGVVNGAQTYEAIPEGSLYYEMDLNINGTPVSSINDFTIFNWYGERNPISIAEVYFYKGNMVASNGCSTSSSEGFPVLWQLDQENDYRAFRLKNSVGECLNGNCSTTSDANDANAIYTNERLLNDYSLKWYVTVLREIPVEQWIRHRESYLKEYTKSYYDQDKLKRQGLITDPDSEWKIQADNLDGFIQNVNVFEITHYVKKGKTMEIEFPTVLNTNNDHVLYQRFYRYDENEMNMDLDNLKAHVSLDTRQDGNVQYFLYKNGMVTGLKLDWKYDDSTPIPAGGVVRKAQRRFNFTNSDGQKFDVAVDVSRYSDLEYLNESSHLDGDLKEPSLTMRYIFHMNDAKDMARELMACTESSGKWKDKVKEIHFPAKRISYENQKNPVYQGEFLSLRHVFRDYWVFDDPDYATTYSDAELENHLVSAEKDNSSGRIKVEIQNNTAGITLGGHEVNGVAQGYYHYDEGAGKNQYGDSRFMVFKYPSNGVVTKPNENTPASADLCAFFVDDNGNRYQICKYHIIFDTEVDSETKRWTAVKDTERDPNTLRVDKGKPIAKISFDYPDRSTGEHADPDRNFYHTPNTGQTYHNLVTVTEGHILDPSSEIGNSSPIPLPFSTKSSNTNYSFDGYDCSWGSYALISQSQTLYGYNKPVYPANTFRTVNDNKVGYAIKSDEGMQDGFLYIDASEQPGDICSISFQGEFCPSDKLFCSGWISGANFAATDGFRCPGGITLTMKGENDNGGTEDIYRFCPGQCYELNYEGTCVEWQQFFFEFSIPKKFRRYWMEVNNNCVSSNGGDFMLDNIEIYTIVPEVVPEINTPLCVSLNEQGEPVTDMRLLRLDVDFNKLKASAETTGSTAKVGFVFLEKEKFLTKLRQLKSVGELYPGLTSYPDMETMTLDILEGRILLNDNDLAYRAAFDEALLGEKIVWDPDPSNTNTSVSTGAGVMYFNWNTTFENNPAFTFANAVNKQSAVFRYKDEDDYPWLVLNGNYLGLDWKTSTDYFIVPTNAPVDPENTDNSIYEIFNICSQCSRASLFRIEPPLEVLGLDATENTEDLVACEGQIPTLLTNLKGYDIHGNELTMKNLNFDWWLGKKGDTTTNPVTPPVPATLDNYHAQYRLINENGEDVNTNRIYLGYALSTMRAYYPDVTSLDVVTEHVGENENPKLTQAMIDYLREVVDAGELLLHQSAISVPAEKVLDSDPYFYLVACPIHDEMYDQALNPSANEYVAFYCDEPQGVRIKLGQKAPTLQTGFVPGEHGFTEYNYNFPANTNPVLSIRLAKAAQFETVKNTVTEGSTPSTDVNYLWLPIRNAETESAQGVIKMSDDDNIYLAASNDLTWDKKISKEMNKNGLPPVVGRIVRLQAINTKEGATVSTTENAYNRLAIYFKKDFNVREGYNYTLSLPFQEDEPDSEKRNACNGTILINLKIVPDYEVWTGAAGNIDWNNDENWRRADGNTASNLLYDVYGDELYRANGAENNANSPLYKYTTNKDNYYSSATSKRKPTREPKPSSDQVLRKGFAPLYCTHVLFKNDEWGNAPELYDALDYKKDPTNPNYLPTNATLNAYPFPNLRETSTPILKFDMQARRWNMWEETYGVEPDRGREGHPNDLIAEMYQINSCDEIAFQPGTELRNAHLLNYNNAWMEYQLDNKRWYLLGSPLQGTISGEWYAPKTTAQQKTTYYDPVAFRPRYIKVTNPKPTDNPSERSWYTKNGDNYVLASETTVNSETDYYYQYTPTAYDRYNPAIYQRSWDKAKAVLYEVGSEYATTDDDQTTNLGNDYEGSWLNGSWHAPVDGADEYLDRLGYKPFGDKKANVAIKGIWSNTYNDAQVDYATGGFSVMVMNHLKGTVNDKSGNKSIIRLPKEDTMYDYYEFSQTNANNGGTDTELTGEEGVQVVKNRALNRGRLKTDLLLPEPIDGMTSYATPRKTEVTASVYGDQRTYTRVPTTEAMLQEMNGANFAFTETVPAGVSNLGFYLVENPFPCGLDMAKFFEANSVTFTQEEIDAATSSDNPAYGKTTNDVKSGLERKYWLLTKAAEGQNPRQVLVQQAPDGEWVTSDGDVINYTNPNYVTPNSGDSGSGDSGSTEPETLPFYPHAVVAPGQGFFVQAKGISGDLTVNFNRDMQAQSRFGMKDNEHGTTYTIVVGQAQVMQKHKEYVDHDNNPETPDVLKTVFVLNDLDGDGEYGELLDLNNNGTYGEEDVTITVDGEEVVVDEIEGEAVMEPKYETDEDTGELIPVLTDIEEEVIIYKYVPETLSISDDVSTPDIEESGTINKEYPLLSRRTRSTDLSPMHGLVITAKRSADQSSALVMKRESASDDFLPAEDTETFISMEELKQVPMVYTLCGRLATTINSIHDFRCLPLGVESNSEAPCTLTFQGVEQLGDSVAFYDAVERKLTPLESGMKFTISGQTQNRYYLVSSLNEEEVAEETHLQIFTEGHTARVIASTAEPITDVRCFDAAGRLVHSASPQTMEYSFTLPDDGIYIIEAKTEKDRKTKKVAVK